MNLTKKRRKFLLFMGLMCIFLTSNILNIYKLKFNSNEDNLNKDAELFPPETVKKANILDPKTEVIGSIENRDGKIFCKISTTDKDLYINRYQPGLNDQPNLYLENWNLTHARMQFENIKALNYTKDIETEFSEFIVSSKEGPIYYYQKFSVELSQYVNNVSIFILDVINPTNYSDENSWEVAIVNCSEDGTPNQFETLGALQKFHPLKFLDLHWEIFDFKNSEVGAVYLNKSKTDKTIENGISRYWFAIRVKIPTDDSGYGGGPKLLFFNPDEGTTSNIGEGETFAQSPEFTTDNYTINYVKENNTINGTCIQGGITSFKNWTDNDRYLVKNESQSVNITTRFELEELKHSKLNWSELQQKIMSDFLHNDLNWWIRNHYKYVFSIDFYLAINVSNKGVINNANLTFYNFQDNVWNISDTFLQEDLTQENETLLTHKIRDPIRKAIYILTGIDTNANRNNSLTFKFEYESDGINEFNVSINQFTLEIGELEKLDTIQQHDPSIQELYFVNNVTHSNGTKDFVLNETIEALKFNDNKRIENKAKTNNISIEFTLNVLNELNSSLWDVDFYDWITINPYPIIPLMEIRVASNVSIRHEHNITLATLELYKGNKTSEYLSDEQNNASWIQVSYYNRSLAFTEEKTEVIYHDEGFSWIFLQFLNESNNNTVKMRLRYQTNVSKGDPDWAFNVSINHASINFYIQNAYTSDIASKIGLGLNSASLTPTLIGMKNFGINISNNGYQKGIWDRDISDGVPQEGVFEFNVTSNWPEITFDVIGIYEIERYQSFNWEYLLSDKQEKVLWNASAEFLYDSHYNVIKERRGLQIRVPSDWMFMKVFNSTGSTPIIEGGWYWENYSNNPFKVVTVYNISDGIWKIGMNSSKNTLLLNLNSTNNIFIDETVGIDIRIQDFYGGDVYFEIYNLDSEIIYSETKTLNETNLENLVSYNWDIFSTTKLPGTYHLKAYWILYNETHAFLALNTTEIIVSKYNVNLDILNIEQLSKTFIYGSDILIEGRLINNETGAIIEGESIIAEIYDENLNLIETKSDITNNEGIIQIEYTLPTGYSKVSIGLVYNVSGTYYSTGQSVQTLEINQISQTDYYLNVFFNFLPYIGAALGIAITTVVGLKYRKSKLRKFWAGESMILDDLLKTSYIMIISKDVGVSIYDKKISLDIDVDLISGFLQAISAFKTEIKKEKEEVIIKAKGFEMDYYDFKIVITDGDYIRTALILDGKPSEKLKENQWAFTEHFEKRFEDDLKEFTGDITSFRKADDLIERYFNISLVHPLKLGKHYEVIKVKGLDKALLEVAEQIQKERKFFFISSLLNFALAGRKASKDEIISVIIDLKRKGLIIPANIE